MIDIIYDPAKNARNIEKRGLSFELVKRLEWDTISIRDVTRAEYRERRFRAWGLISNRLYVLIYTMRDGMMRVISFRKGNSRERKMYDEEIDEAHYEKETSQSVFD